jgi:glycosyltransferase involved in cell wall biosynthesis
MRIAYVTADFGVPVFGTNGSSAHVRAVLRALLGRGATIDLFASRLDGPSPDDLAAIRVLKLPRASRRLPQPERERRAILANADVARKLAEHGPYDLIYERHSLWSAAGMGAARAAGISGLLEVNAPLLEETAQFRTLVDHEAAERQVRQAFSDARALLAVSRGVARYLDGFAEARGRIHVVQNGVEPGRFQPPHRRRRAGDPVVVGFLGSLRPWHGLDGLVHAMHRLAGRDAPARLLIVGKGPERERLEDLAAELGITEQIEWTGAVPEAQVPDALARMDIAVAPYPALPDFYFSPLKLFEYMAAGLPVVTTSVGDLPELIEDGRTGLLVPPDDPEALARAIAGLASDPVRCRSLGEAARARVIERHSWQATAARILEIAGRAHPAPGIAA